MTPAARHRRCYCQKPAEMGEEKGIEDNWRQYSTCFWVMTEIAQWLDWILLVLWPDCDWIRAGVTVMNGEPQIGAAQD